MRARTLALLLAGLVFGLALPPTSAEAHHRRAPDYYAWYKTDVTYDRYAYDYSYRRHHRSYYPHYDSGYWRPAYILRYRKACCRPNPVLPPYYQAWGYPKHIKAKHFRRGHHLRKHRHRHEHAHW